MLLVNNFLVLFLCATLIACKVDQKNIKINSIININKDGKKIEQKQKEKNDKKSFPKYVLGDSYFIEGVEHIPVENYSYNENGLATFYGKELHNKKTINNEHNKVTELFGRHKTLPIPSVVKLTNLENGLSLIVKINDRHYDNKSIIQVSRKVAQLLRFYKSGIARVNVEILADPSKQLKIVTQSMNDPKFNETLQSAPTEIVTVSELDNSNEVIQNNEIFIEKPIELGFENVEKNELFIKIDDFNSYSEAKLEHDKLNQKYKTTIQNDNSNYSIIFGPMTNEEADNLFQFLLSKGYNNPLIIIK